MRAIDPIDRIALMEKLGIKEECTVCERNSDPYCKWKPDVVDVCEAICTAPTIEPQRKKGRWIPKFNGMFKGGAYWFKCSECERIVPEVRNGGWNYCPNCGADMRRPEDDIPMEYFESGGAV